MADQCFNVGTPYYLSLAGAITLPTAIQIEDPTFYKWIVVNPGNANQGGSAGASSLIWRVYKGANLTPNKWVTGYSLSMPPMVSQQWQAGQVIIPWNDSLNLIFELAGLGTWGTGSAIDFTLSPFSDF